MSMFYSFLCNECAEELTYEVEFDGDFDLHVRVNPCEVCLHNLSQEMKRKLDEAINEMKED